jgi:large subunit ribosomal protein L24
VRLFDFQQWLIIIEIEIMALRIKKGDTVEVTAGDGKGSTGKVLRVLPDEGKVIVQGQNLAKKHVRPSRRNPQGGRINIEKPIDISNVQPVNPKSSRGTRIRFERGKDGSKKRVGLDGTEISVVTRAK